MTFDQWQAQAMSFEEWLARAMTKRVRQDPDLLSWLGTDADGAIRFYVYGIKPHATIVGYDEAGNINETYRLAILELREPFAAEWVSGEQNVTKRCGLRILIADRSIRSMQPLLEGGKYFAALFEPPARATIDDDEFPDWRTIQLKFGPLSAFEFADREGEWSAELEGVLMATSMNSTGG